MNKIDKNWQLKIICFLLAIVLWFVIINEQNPLSEGSYTVPITVETSILNILHRMYPRRFMSAFRGRAIRSST